MLPRNELGKPMIRNNLVKGGVKEVPEQTMSQAEVCTRTAVAQAAFRLLPNVRLPWMLSRLNGICQHVSPRIGIEVTGEVLRLAHC